MVAQCQHLDAVRGQAWTWMIAAACRSLRCERVVARQEVRSLVGETHRCVAVLCWARLVLRSARQ